LIIKQLLKLL